MVRFIVDSGEESRTFSIKSAASRDQFTRKAQGLRGSLAASQINSEEIRLDRDLFQSEQDLEVQRRCKKDLEHLWK